MPVNKENIHAQQAQRSALSHLQKNKVSLSIQEWAQKISSGDIQALSKIISLAESTKVSDTVLAKDIIASSQKKQALRIGITGIPGVGKSTFINTLAQKLSIHNNKKIAILAIDPSSENSGGSILGDKTRMTDIATAQNIFIRPTPTGNYLGGLHPATLDVTKLCEAAGFDYVLIETVGVGQSEHHIAHLADINFLLLVPNAGDELQGLKSGIVEQSDAIIIHKADAAYLNLAKVTLNHYSKALRWRTKASKLPLFMVSSTEDRGFEEVCLYLHNAENDPTIFAKREEDEIFWIRLQLENHILKYCNNHPKFLKWIKTNNISSNYSKLFDIKLLMSYL